VLPGRAFPKTVCLSRHLGPLPPELGDAFVDRVIGRRADLVVVDCVRLNVMTRKGGV
jgi:hypothetical protein